MDVIFSWLYSFFGIVLYGIDNVISYITGLFNGGVGLHNTGLCIIFLTIVIYTIMFPLNSKQQRSSRLMSRINPEIKKIQKKYKGRKDQESQIKMNEETQNLYAKYGINPFGGCLSLIITMPILWSLYRVIMCMNGSDQFKIPEIENYISNIKTEEAVNFLGLKITQTPMEFFNNGSQNGNYLSIFAFLIPILAMVLQFINTKIVQTNQPESPMGDQANSMVGSMKMMNYMMPIMSGVFCVSLPMGIGLYWIVGSMFRIFQGIIINKQVDKIDLDDLIEKNKEKAAKKIKKTEERNKQMQEYTKARTAGIKNYSGYNNDSSSDKNKNNNKNNNNNVSDKKYKEGSIAGYANMMSGKKDK